MTKRKLNFWDKVPKMTNKEKQQEIKDLGYDPLSQTPVGKEKIND